MKFFIIDDSPVTREIIIKEISKKRSSNPDDSFTEANDGMEALTIIKSSIDIDIILCDWNMPNMNGIDFVKVLRKLDKYKETKLLMVTTESDRKNVLMAIAAGVNDYITKPIDGDKIWLKIKNFFPEA